MSIVTPPVAGRRSSLMWLVPLAVAVLVAVLWWTGSHGSSGGGGDDRGARPTATARPSPTAYPSVLETPDSGLDTIDESALPAEGRVTLDRIRGGGPFPYEQDDKTFQNREGILPEQKRGYYREYTVETPGSSDRGARRIISGTAGDRFWTDDHYDSFRQIKEGQ
ncbi:ribonuclease domain-containing protein [Knoellia sp. CPCC 206450]|uniref:ribonuclease domain-containing protein n=1 Tax=Knoellia tibetensis TaxID=3404798 RepID=UPI003B436461